ncbi:hypothetical protein GmHk_19G054990 [Glycine max]|nr:hypothetical protein GmHk_19G054990 [Glycine max]
MLPSTTSEYLGEWKQARRHDNQSTNQLQTSHDQNWLPPPIGSLKPNVDVAIFQDRYCFGAGMCIRDEQVVEDLRCCNNNATDSEIILSKCSQILDIIPNSIVSFCKEANQQYCL